MDMVMVTKPMVMLKVNQHLQQAMWATQQLLLLLGLLLTHLLHP